MKPERLLGVELLGQSIKITTPLTDLDYFAGQALTGMSNVWTHDAKSLSKRCYDLAQAMLDERERRQKENQDAKLER